MCVGTKHAEKVEIQRGLEVAHTENSDTCPLLIILFHPTRTTPAHCLAPNKDALFHQFIVGLFHVVLVSVLGHTQGCVRVLGQSSRGGSE